MPMSTWISFCISFYFLSLSVSRMLTCLIPKTFPTVILPQSPDQGAETCESLVFPCGSQHVLPWRDLSLLRPRCVSWPLLPPAHSCKFSLRPVRHWIYRPAWRNLTFLYISSPIHECGVSAQLFMSFKIWLSSFFWFLLEDSLELFLCMSSFLVLLPFNFSKYVRGCVETPLHRGVVLMCEYSWPLSRLWSPVQSKIHMTSKKKKKSTYDFWLPTKLNY